LFPMLYELWPFALLIHFSAILACCCTWMLETWLL
jgi:hypothetical protein